MNIKKELICIGCPMGCMVEVFLIDNKIQDIKGYTCNKGKIYAQKECTHPTRIVTSTVKVKNGEVNMVSVKTESDIPKDKIKICIDELNNMVVEAPINTGDILLRNIADTGVNIIATKDIKKSV